MFFYLAKMAERYPEDSPREEEDGFDDEFLEDVNQMLAEIDFSDVPQAGPQSPSKVLERNAVRKLNQAFKECEDRFVHLMKTDFIPRYLRKVWRMDRAKSEVLQARKANSMIDLSDLKKKFAQEQGNLQRIYYYFVETARDNYPDLHDYYCRIIAFFNLLLESLVSFGKLLAVQNMYLQQDSLPLSRRPGSRASSVLRSTPEMMADLVNKVTVQLKDSHLPEMERKLKLVDDNMLQNLHQTEKYYMKRLNLSKDKMFEIDLKSHLTWVCDKVTDSLTDLQTILNNFESTFKHEEYIVNILKSRAEKQYNIYQEYFRYLDNVLEGEKYGRDKLVYLFNQFFHLDSITAPVIPLTAAVLEELLNPLLA